jgi:hypothetical protein
MESNATAITILLYFKMASEKSNIAMQLLFQKLLRQLKMNLLAGRE